MQTAKDAPMNNYPPTQNAQSLPEDDLQLQKTEPSNYPP